MRFLNKTLAVFLAGTLAFSACAVTAFAADDGNDPIILPPKPLSSTIEVTASSNFAPSVTKTFSTAEDQITATWWLCDTEDVMVNVQGLLTYDSSVLTVDMTDGVNRTYDAEADEFTENILCITKGENTVVNYQPKTLPEGADAGIRFNSTQPSGYSMGSVDGKVPFFSVTFNPVSGAKGATDVHLEIFYMGIKSEGDKNYHKMIYHSEIIDTSAVYLPNEATAVYAGPFDPDYESEEPTTAEPTTAEPTTAEPTTAEPTTAEPTTAEPTTAEPTTAEPTTAEPTTAEPTTAEPTTAEPTTAEPTTAEPTTAEPTTAEPTTAEPTTAEPTTAEPTTAEPTTAEPTEPATAEPTTVISYLTVTPKAYVLDTVAAAYPAVSFSTDNTPTVVNKGETVKMIYRLDAAQAVKNLSWTAEYDPEFLTLKTVSMPLITDGSVIDTDTIGLIKATASNVTSPYKLQPTDDFVIFEFEAVKDGETEFGATLTDLLLEETAEPTTAEPTSAEPTTAEPTTAEPTTAEPTTAEPTTAEPTTVEPTTVEPTTVEPTTVEPTTVEPTTVEPTTVEPTTAEPTTEPTPAYVLGDVNNDGKVDVTDATLVQMIAAEVIVPKDIQKLAGDVNRDGKVDVTDATLIQMFAAEVIDHF